MADSVTRLYNAVLAAEGADPAKSRTARLMRAGRAKMAKKVAEEAVEDVFPLPRELVGEGTLFLLQVKGDSMIDAGILEGDTVVVEKRTTANVGDIVVAILDNEFTLKRLAREKGRIVLRPENKAYPVIRPKDDPEICGGVVGQFRRYR